MQPARPGARRIRIGCSGWNYASWRQDGSRGRRGNYSQAELEEWAQRLERWSESVDVLAYFNNDWEVFAVRNALWLKARLGC